MDTWNEETPCGSHRGKEVSRCPDRKLLAGEKDGSRSKGLEQCQGYADVSPVRRMVKVLEKYRSYGTCSNTQ